MERNLAERVQVVISKVGEYAKGEIDTFFIVNGFTISKIVTEKIAQGEAPRRLVTRGITSQ